MAARSTRVWLGLGILLGCYGAAPRAADKPLVDSKTVLNVRLTTTNELSSVSQRALVNETESIWRDANVQLRWLTDNAETDGGRPLRILVTRRAVSAANQV